MMGEVPSASGEPDNKILGRVFGRAAPDSDDFDPTQPLEGEVVDPLTEAEEVFLDMLRRLCRKAEEGAPTEQENSGPTTHDQED